jgi:acyl-coenzyme A thioesterase PaaI-like protein
MSDETSPPDPGLASRGTPQSTALGVEVRSDALDGRMHVPFRADLVGDPDQGGLAEGVIVTLLDQACGFAISTALRSRAEADGRELKMGAMATLDFRIDYVRPARPGQGVTATAECLRISGEVAFVRGSAYETDPADPVAIAQAAFMISSSLVAA